MRSIAARFLETIHTRGELFAVEFEEQRAALIELCIWIVLAGVLGFMFLFALTALVILLAPWPWRVVVLAVFSVVYLTGAVLAVWNVRALWRNAPQAFGGTMDEVKRDAEWLESLK
jgi:uncharacterized membrane protein YqjE